MKSPLFVHSAVLMFLAFSPNVLKDKDPIKRPLLVVDIDLNRKAQTIDNFGSSGCWFSEGIGKDWPVEKKEKIAELLFSKKMDKNGQPLGIGLSAWRFNVGAGTLEQGDQSGIKDFRKRSDSFLGKDGSYDWNKQEGQRFFLQKAKNYGVETLIAFSNSPPVQFTKNGLGFKTEKDYLSNLRDDSYEDYGRFLATVIKHFKKEGLNFNYVSPVNEPQWDWSKKFMEADQEGSPWRNEEISKIAKVLDQELSNQNLDTKILVTEAGQLNYLYGGSGLASKQIQHFFNPKSTMYLGNLKHIPKIIAGHSYFTESNDSVLLHTRKQLADTIGAFGIKYWQSEYSMLADGFREGSKGQIKSMDCALFLSKVIHTDLTVGNATAWQFWNAYEPGSADFNTRYYLIALNPDPDFKDGKFSITKNLWALGHYSRFIRPGMTRIITSIAATKHTPEENKNLMISAFADKFNKLVVVATNYGVEPLEVELNIKNGKKNYKNMSTYLTTGADGMNMKPSGRTKYLRKTILPARSISTIVFD
jgi:O-glycosyl hydrolase